MAAISAPRNIIASVYLLGIGLAATVPSKSSESSTLDLSSNFLPESFPEGVDPSHYALPVFLEEPKDTYAARGAPAVLTCRIAHALKAYFVCNDEKKVSISEEDLQDPKTNMKYKKISIEISKPDTMDVIGHDFGCKCLASSAKGEVESKEAIIKPAFLRRDFDTPPYSQQIELGKQAQLRCHPPKGSPPPRVIAWLKNGVKIADKNFIQSATGNLLIIQARMEDSGNYTCVVSNDVLTRKSPVAVLTIYVPGQWSNWSNWSECSATCGRGIRKRTRICNNPAPINNGPGCEGLAVEKKSCNQVCPAVDGKWTSWSSWSSCSSDCQQFRRRLCNNPKPSNGGRYCLGDDIAKQNCTGGMCKPGLHSIVLYGTEPPMEAPSSSLGATDLTLCIGLVVAFIIFLAVVLIIVKILRKKNIPHSGYTLTAAGGVMDSNSGADGSIGHRMSKNGSSALGYTPDLTSGVHNEYNYTYSDKNSNCSSQKGNTHTHCDTGMNGHSTPIPMVNFSDFRPMSEHLYEQPMLNMTQHSHHHQQQQKHSQNSPAEFSQNSHERTPFFSPSEITSPNKSSVPSSGQPSPTTTFSTSTRLTNTISTTGGTFSKNVSYQNMNWATVTETGTRITVPQSTVTLTIPQGAVPSGRTQDIYVAVLNQDKSQLRLEPSQIPVTPLVQWGGNQRGTCISGTTGNNTTNNRLNKLQKPVVLSVPHVGNIQKDPKMLQIYHCPDLELDNAEWILLNNNSDNLQIDPSFCHLVTDQVGSFLLVQQLLHPGGSGSAGSRPGSGSHPGGSTKSTTYANVSSIMSNTTRQALCRCLDVPTCQGNDWRKLAEVIGANQYSAHFANQSSPSEAILNLWESGNHFKDSTSALAALAQILRDINRPDAIVILERELK